jgi:hypothetical protein
VTCTRFLRTTMPPPPFTFLLKTHAFFFYVHNWYIMSSSSTLCHPPPMPAPSYMRVARIVLMMCEVWPVTLSLCGPSFHGPAPYHPNAAQCHSTCIYVHVTSFPPSLPFSHLSTMLAPTLTLTLAAFSRPSPIPSLTQICSGSRPVSVSSRCL